MADPTTDTHARETAASSDPILLALSRLQTDLNKRLDGLEEDLRSLRRTIKQSGEDNERKLYAAATGFATQLGSVHTEITDQFNQVRQILRRLG